MEKLAIGRKIRGRNSTDEMYCCKAFRFGGNGSTNVGSRSFDFLAPKRIAFKKFQSWWSLSSVRLST